MDNPEKAFLVLSSHLTGYSQTDLLGTGMLAEYYRCVANALNGAACARLWALAHEIEQDPASAKPKLVCLMTDPTLGPAAKNIITLWYLGSWPDATAQFGAKFTSVEAYQEGLIWDAIGAHPPGAKQPGFGSWAELPLVKIGGQA